MSIYSQSTWTVPNQTPLPRHIPSQAAPASLESLDKARASVNAILNEDVKHLPELNSFLNVSASSDYSRLPNDAWAPFCSRKRIPIPGGLPGDEYTSCETGLLPEINRIWWAYKTKLFLWDYAAEDDTIFDFPEQRYIVRTVGIVNIRQGIFQDAVKKLIVIVTAGDINLWGFTGGMPDVVTPGAPVGPSIPMRVYNLDISVPTPTDQMHSLVGTDDGRIFVAGTQDGCIYELTYYAKEGWFGRRASLENRTAVGYNALVPSFWGATKLDKIRALAIDSARHCLYAVTLKNDVSIYYLGVSTAKEVSSTFTHVYTHTDVFGKALSLSPSNQALPSKDKFNVIQLFPTSTQESKTVHLVAVTDQGVRLYFSHHKKFGSLTIAQPNKAPDTLDLIHVRSPPMVPFSDVVPRTNPSDYNHTAEAIAMQPQPPPFWPFTEVFISALSGSLFLCAHVVNPTLSSGAETDVVLACAPDLARLGSFNALNARPALAESWSVMLVDGSTFDIKPASPPYFVLPSPDASILSSELVTMFTSPPATFHVLTNQSVHIISQRHPVDHLRQIFDNVAQLNNADAALQFQDVWGRDQTCAMTLAVACGHPANGDLLSPAPGTDLRKSMGIRGPGLGVFDATPLSEQALNAAKMFFYNQGGKPQKADRTQRADAYQFSGRHEGLLIFTSRLLRPIWKNKVITTVGGKPQSGISMPILTLVRGELNMLKVFMDKNPGLFNSVPAQYQMKMVIEDDAVKAEQASCARIKDLISRTIEAISFITLLIDFQLPDIMAHCDAQVKADLVTLTYEDLLVTERGRNIARELVNALINNQIAKQQSVDAVSEQLGERCGSFCEPGDVLIYKAMEAMRAAKAAPYGQQMLYLRESASLFSQGIKTIKPEKLPEYTTWYCDLKYPPGAVGLPLRCAKEWDPQNQGITFYSDRMPRGDSRAEFYEKRRKAYDCVLQALSFFDAAVQNSTGPVARISDDPVALQQLAYQLALRSDDQLWHEYLYNWFISNGQSKRLLNLDTPFVEPFLAKEPTISNSNLLWQFYINAGRARAAAKVLDNMAQSQEPGVTLEHRLEYLSRAISCAKAASGIEAESEDHVEYLRELEDRMEVAQLQTEIWNQIAVHYEQDPQTRQQILGQLESKLWTITELYQNFAVPHDLNLAKLLIINVSGYEDIELVMSTWRTIMEQAHTTAEARHEFAPPHLAAEVSRCSQRLYPSNVALPVGRLLEELLIYAYRFKEDLQPGWAVRCLADGAVPYASLFEALELIYGDHSSPLWGMADGGAFLLTEIAATLNDWFRANAHAMRRPDAAPFPAAFVEQKVNEYLTKQLSDAGRRTLSDLSATIRGRF